jgi:hypothetical protein
MLGLHISSGACMPERSAAIMSGIAPIDSLGLTALRPIPDTRNHAFSALIVFVSKMEGCFARRLLVSRLVGFRQIS